MPRQCISTKICDKRVKELFLHPSRKIKRKGRKKIIPVDTRQQEKERYEMCLTQNSVFN